ncbi:MAG: SMI1/KNR4 family protein [Candidatus Sericytochromatia bacterium]
MNYVENWNNWLKNLNSFSKNIENKDWFIDFELEIIKPIELKKIQEIENNKKIKLPSDFIYLLNSCASEVYFSWSIPPNYNYNNEIKVYGGGGDFLWNINSILEKDFYYDNFVITKDVKERKIWENKIPFIEIGNGDLIAFDYSSKKDNYPIVYLSMDCMGLLHGKILEENIIDFFDVWTFIGCVGPESNALEQFYDFRKGKLFDKNNLLVKKWLNFIENNK